MEYQLLINKKNQDTQHLITAWRATKNRTTAKPRDM